MISKHFKLMVIVSLVFIALGLFFAVRFESQKTITQTSFSDQSAIQKLKNMSDHSKIQAEIYLQEQPIQEQPIQEQPIQKQTNQESSSISLALEVVNTPVSLAKGLGDRSEIGSDGMLFVFSQPTETSFWMYGMKFDLDMIWIKDSIIVEITENVPAPQNSGLLSMNTERNLPTYPSPGEVDMVLEVRAGFSRENGILPGDRLVIK